MALEAAEEFQSSLNDLTFNSKPLINMLTMLADENVQFAPQIVQVIEAHVQKARPGQKLPCVYLIDSIIKNVQGGNYKQLFAQNIVSTFCGVFEKVDEKTRQSMFKLRQTWSEMFPATKMYALDVRVNNIDPAWPITAPPDFSKVGSIHVNPKFIVQTAEPKASSGPAAAVADMEEQESQMRQQLIAKQQELLKLQQQQLELELAETKAKLALQQKELEKKDQMLNQQEMKAVVKPPVKETPLSVAGVPIEKLNIRDPRLAKRLESKQTAVETKPVVPDIGIDLPGVSTLSPARLPKSPEKKAVKKDPRAAAKERWKPSADVKKETVGKAGPAVEKDSKVHPHTSKNSPKVKPVAYTIPKTNSESRRKDRGADKSPVRASDKDGRSISRSNTRRSDRDDKRDNSSRSSHRDSSRSTSKEKDDKRPERYRRNYRSTNREHSKSPDNAGHRSGSSQRSRSRSPRRNKSSPRRDKTLGKDPSQKLSTNTKNSSSSGPGRGDSKNNDNHKDEAKKRSASKDKDERPDFKEQDPKRRESKDVDERSLGMDCSGKTTNKRSREPQGSKDKDERIGPSSSKRNRRDDAKEDISDLFGSEDQDYRQPPLGISLSQSFPPGHSFPPKSPHVGWAKFKANNPLEFPDPQPSPSRAPPIASGPPMNIRIPRRKPLLDRRMSQDVENLEIPQALLIDQQEEILQQAERQLKSGDLSHDQHQELLKQLAELYKLQKLKTDLARRNSVDSEQQVNTSHDGTYEDRLKKIKNTVIHRQPEIIEHGHTSKNMGPRPPLLAAPGFTPRPPMHRPAMPLMQAPLRGPSNHYPQFPRHPIDRRTDIRPPGPANHRQELLPLHPPPAPPMYVKANEPTKPSDDLRFRTVLQQKRNDGSELVIDDRCYELTPGFPPRRLNVFGGSHLVCANALTREILLDGCCRYSMGDPMREIVVEGKRHTIYFHGALNNVWIDGVQYNIRFDAPPQRIMIGSEQHEISINSLEMKVYIDCQGMGKWGGPPREIELDGHKHEIRFEAPPREILIDNKLCQLNFQYIIPIIMIGNKPHGVRFDGPPRSITIDGIDFVLPMDRPVKIKLGKRPHEIAFGGPGYEVIMGGKCYEVQFNGPPRDIWIGGRVRKVQLKGPPPEVKILDEISPAEMMKLTHRSKPKATPEERRTRSTPLMKRDAPRDAPRGVPLIQPPHPAMAPNQGHRLLPPFIPPQPGHVPSVSHERPKYPEVVPPAVNHPPTQINVNDLFSKLLTAGIITKTESKVEDAIPAKDSSKETKEYKPDSPDVHEEAIEEVPDLTNLDITKMKQYYGGVLQKLYTGIQCSSCGARFSHDETEGYREHLDWHFRQNKRDKEDANVARCRKWFYNIQDWIMYIEIEDTEEVQQAGYFGDEVEEEQVQAFSAYAAIEGVEMEPAATGEDSDDTCAVCGDPFDQVWHEEKEEWHLKEALRFKGKTYHHACYDDALQTSLIETPTPSAQPSQPFFTNETNAAPVPALDLSSEPLRSPGTPVKDESAGSPGTPVRDEIMSPGTPLKDEVDVENEHSTGLLPESAIKVEVEDSTVIKQEPMDISCVKVEIKEEPTSSNEIGSQAISSELPSTQPKLELTSVKSENSTDNLSMRQDGKEAPTEKKDCPTPEKMDITQSAVSNTSSS